MPTGMRIPRLFAVAVSLCLPAPAARLDPFHTDSARLLDSTGRVVVLRGVVTITRNNDGKPMVMTTEDYDRIKSWGYNV